MKLICPQCNFTRDLEESAIPTQPVQATCPKCEAVFRFDPTTVKSNADAPPVDTQNNFVTPPTVDETVEPDAQIAETVPEEDVTAGAGIAAGFWLRAVAAVLDSVISSALQFTMVYALGNVVELSGSSTLPMVQMLIMLFSALAGVFYYVFFTGYSGQTPGKIALRLKVVRLDDTQVSYGQAFIRETIGKFISGIVLGIGYLMVALRRDKRGLHDLMADTKVIKI